MHTVLEQIIRHESVGLGMRVGVSVAADVELCFSNHLSVVVQCEQIL